MFEKFDEQARQVVLQAHELASKGGYKSIRPTHMAIAASLVLDKDHQQAVMAFTPACALHLGLLDDSSTITAEDIYEKFKGK